MDDQFRHSFISANLIPPQIPPQSLLQAASQKQSNKQNAKNQTYGATAVKAVSGKISSAPAQERSTARRNGNFDTEPGRNLRASTLPVVSQPGPGIGRGPPVPQGSNENGSRQPRQPHSQVHRVESYNAPAASSGSVPRDDKVDFYGNRPRQPDREFRKMPIIFVKAQDPVSDLVVPGEGPKDKKLNDSSSSDEDCGGVALKPKSPISDLTSKFAAMMQAPGEGAVKKHCPALGDSAKVENSMLVTNKNIQFFPYYTGASANAAVNEKNINKQSITQVSFQSRVGANSICKGSTQVPAVDTSPRPTDSKDITYKQSSQVPNANTKPGPTDKSENPTHKQIPTIAAVSIKPQPTQEGTAYRRDARNLTIDTKLRPTENANIRSYRIASDSGGNRYGQPLLHPTGNPELGSPNPRSGVYRDGELVAGSNTIILWKSNNGLKLMMKMGYKLGERLGRCSDGVLEPVPMVLWKGRYGVGFMYQLPYDCGVKGEDQPEYGNERNRLRDERLHPTEKTATTRVKGEDQPEYGNERNRLRDERLHPTEKTATTRQKFGGNRTYPDPRADSHETRYSAGDFYQRRAARDKFTSILEHHELTHRRLDANEVGALFTWCIDYMIKNHGKLFNSEEMEALLKGRYAKVVGGERDARKSYWNR